MRISEFPQLIVEQKALPSLHLRRYVIVDCFVPRNNPSLEPPSLLLVNDGQNLEEMPFAPMLNDLQMEGSIPPLLCAGIHCGQHRMEEYGTAGILDYKGRGTKAEAYQRFLLEELIPFIKTEFGVPQFSHQAIAGFSLGGLSALDTAWTHPDVFQTAGVFSGSLWWRTRDIEDDYDEDRDRIMPARIRGGEYRPGHRFYFTTGSLDEQIDRNNNGIIDSIDDTLAVIAELEAVGYTRGQEIGYVNIEDGCHDVPTWARAMPDFLKWGWGRKGTQPTVDGPQS